MIKFFNGRKLVYTVYTNNSAGYLTNLALHGNNLPDKIEWTRYKIN